MATTGTAQNMLSRVDGYELAAQLFSVEEMGVGEHGAGVTNSFHSATGPIEDTPTNPCHEPRNPNRRYLEAREYL